MPVRTTIGASTLAGFPVRFEWALDDLRALVSGRPIIAEGWGLRALGMRVIEVDGSVDAEGVTEIVAGQFAEYLADIESM